MTRMPNRRVHWIFHGTSLMEHYEGFAPELVNQSALPPVGSEVVVERWRRRGWVHQLWLRLRAARPDAAVHFDNHALGGATSTDIIDIIAARDVPRSPADIAFLGAGTNDVWRKHQGRLDEHVPIDVYAGALSHAIEQLSLRARHVVIVGEPSFGWDDDCDVESMNAELAEYGDAARRIATIEGARYLDLTTPIRSAASLLGDEDSPWSDGAHLSEVGDAIVASTVEAALRRWRWWPTSAPRRRPPADTARLLAEATTITTAMSGILDEDGHRIDITVDASTSTAQVKRAADVAALGCDRDGGRSVQTRQHWRRFLAETATVGALQPESGRSAGQVQEVNRLAEELGDVIVRGIGPVREAFVLDCGTTERGTDLVLFGRYRTASVHLGLKDDPVSTR
ncbi:hypothetical protein STSO111631_06955 [Stackebrandtia soli]